ncbi:MAG: hypothetical protein AAGA41_01890 [Pseudomonadota bacterium]
MAKRPFKFPRILAESAAIFLGVLLAFVVEQWREDLNERREAEATLNLVRAELTQNLAELEAIAPLRSDMLEEFEEAIMVLKNENRFPDNFPAFRSPDITSIAYELATDSGAVTGVPPKDLLIMARAYEALEEVRRNDTFLNERNAQIRFNDGEQYISGFIYYLNRAKMNEPVAINHVRAAIEALDARNGQID